MNILQGLPEDQWENIMLAYDNMSHLDDLKAAKNLSHLQQKVAKDI